MKSWEAEEEANTEEAKATRETEEASECSGR